MIWAGKKVLVTGADGFIGSHLVEALVRAGARVRGFTYYNSLGSAGWLDKAVQDVREALEVFPGDVRDPGRVRQAVKGQSYVFHLASLIGIPYSYVAPASYVQTNVQGTLHVLEACRAHGVERIIHTSTSEVYGSAQTVPINETHRLHAQSPYAASKIGADKLVESFYLSVGLPVATVRPFNTYGPRQSNRAVISTILHQLLSGQGEIHVGALTPTRDFNYVTDTIAGFLAVAAAEQAVGRVINIGSGQEISIRDLIEILFQITGRQASVVVDETRLRPGASEVNRLVCDASLARELTNWTPAVSLEVGLKHTADWVERQQFSREHLRQVSNI